MNRLITFFVLTILFSSLNLQIAGQKQLRNNPTTDTSINLTEFASVEAFSDGGGVWFKWQMNTESNNLGFNIYRINGENKEQVNQNFISGGFFRNSREITRDGIYSYFDPTGNFEGKYVVETFQTNGQKTLSPYFSVKYINNLADIAGRSSEELVNDFQKGDSIFERNEISLDKELQTEIGENALTPNLPMQRFVASQPGVKLGVKSEGIYRVSRTELQNAGFNVNMPSENWQLFMNGNEQAIIVGQNGDYIEFYGQGIDTIESGTQIYFLINGAQPGKRIQNLSRRRIGGTVVSNSYEQSFYKADRKLYFSDLRNGDANNFVSDKIISTTEATVNFDLDGIDRNSTESTLTIAVQGVTLTPHTINVSINGLPLEQITGTNTNLMTRSYQIPTSVLVEGANNIKLKVPSATNDVSVVESFRVGFARNYLAKQNSLSFVAKQFKQSEVRGFTSGDLRVFDTTFPDAPSVISNLEITQSNGTFGVIIPSNRSRKLFAVSGTGVLPVDSIEENTPSVLATADHNGKLIIISHKNWLNEAETWANYRRNDGFSVEVVRVDDIYDEFNYGIVSANSVRSFLQYAKNNWQISPEYVLIIGDSSYDPRNFTTSPNTYFVPTKMFDTAYEETGSDEALADFNDDGLAEIAVGRIPAQNAAHVTLILNKVMTFEASPSPRFNRGALFASDLPNGYDFAGMNQRLANELPSGTTSVMINRGDVNARTNLLNEINNGRFLVNYSGHGSTGLWAATSFYSINDVPLISSGTNYSIFTMLTCLNGYFIRADFDSIAEAILKTPNGGGVSVWASSGKTTPDVQEVLARRFYQKISQGSILRMGDLIKDAKQNVFGGRDVRLSWSLLGDPTLKVH